MKISLSFDFTSTKSTLSSPRWTASLVTKMRKSPNKIFADIFNNKLDGNSFEKHFFLITTCREHSFYFRVVAIEPLLSNFSSDEVLKQKWCQIRAFWSLQFKSSKIHLNKNVLRSKSNGPKALVCHAYSGPRLEKGTVATSNAKKWITWKKVKKKDFVLKSSCCKCH